MCVNIPGHRNWIKCKSMMSVEVNSNTHYEACPANTKLTGSNQRPPSCPPSHQQTPFIITIDESSTESESDQLNSSPLESDPDDYYFANHPPENQLGFEEWKLQNSCLHGIPEVPEPVGECQLFEETCFNIRVNT